MKKVIAPFSALYRPPRPPPSAPSEKTTLIDWVVEADPQFPDLDPAEYFVKSKGEYVAPIDGLYTIKVQLIPINGATLGSSSRRRQRVDYALRLTSPPDRETNPDAIQSTYLDIGSVSFGELAHLHAGTRIGCIQMPGAVGQECVRMMVDLIQRKRKREQPELTRKELKKLRKDKRKAGAQVKTPSSLGIDPIVSSSDTASSPTGDEDGNSDDDGYSDDSDDSEDWEFNFESDSTSDDLPDSKKNVSRLAKRLKTNTSSFSITE